MHVSMLKVSAVLLLSSFAMVGCANKHTYLDQHFGEAVNAAKAQQIINPDGPLALHPVSGVDGQAAKGSIDRYNRSFTIPLPPPSSSNVFTIGIGGAR